MATLSRNVTEVGRLTAMVDFRMRNARGTLRMRTGDQVSLRSNRVLLRKRVGTSTWKRCGLILEGFDLEVFLTDRLAARNVKGEALWQLGVHHVAPAAPRFTPTVPQPTEEELVGMCITDTLTPWAIDGCEGVDPDGHCVHGQPSWPVYLELI